MQLCWAWRTYLHKFFSKSSLDLRKVLPLCTYCTRFIFLMFNMILPVELTEMLSLAGQHWKCTTILIARDQSKMHAVWLFVGKTTSILISWVKQHMVPYLEDNRMNVVSFFFWLRNREIINAEEFLLNSTYTVIPICLWRIISSKFGILEERNTVMMRSNVYIKAVTEWFHKSQTFTKVATLGKLCELSCCMLRFMVFNVEVLNLSWFMLPLVSQ